MMPLVILSEEGNLVDAGLSSEKAYNKSLEQGAIWVVHADTQRVLPYDAPHTLERIRKERHYVVAVVSDREAAGAGGDAVGKAASAEKKPGGAGALGAGPGGAGPDVPGERGAAAASEERDGSRAPVAVLESLEALIAGRKRDLPEGSYTTHLFSEGTEKIRKKLGEEAVELLLASSRERTISECADLLYHLLVLLAQEEISVREITDELARRHSG
jgi:phosphoribosyl-ATP pyrophosphohydrolase